LVPYARKLIPYENYQVVPAPFLTPLDYIHRSADDS
jgi:hypothetical protein